MSSSAVLPWLVHLYTASGAVIGFVALILVEQAKFQSALWLMSLAVVIDATDGTLARMARVKELIPWFDGDRLEDIIDYLNYVLVPCLFLLRADLLPEKAALGFASLPLLASAYGFCQRQAKTSDHFFLGFPSYWNIVAFYLHVLLTPRWLNGLLIFVLSALVFVPIKYSRAESPKPASFPLKMEGILPRSMKRRSPASRQIPRNIQRARGARRLGRQPARPAASRTARAQSQSSAASAGSRASGASPAANHAAKLSNVASEMATKGDTRLRPTGILSPP